MLCFRILHRRERARCSKRARRVTPGLVSLLRDAQGAAILEFAVALPLLVVFVVGIYDFSGAFNQKQKIEQAAQEGAILAGAQPTSDIASATPPESLQPVETAVFNSLVASGVVPSGACAPPGTVTIHTGVSWTYSISGCSGTYPGDNLIITINRGWVSAPPTPLSVGSYVQVSYPYHWRFNSVIQLLFPGASYSATTQVTESASVHNQM
jgi:Flp pilus assembly protein TadG